MELIETLQDLTRKTRVRPCARHDLECLERELAEILKAYRERDFRLPASQTSPAETAEILNATDAARSALREGLLAHDQAQSEVEQVRQWVARGHLHASVIEANRLRHSVEIFSDLSLDFVTEAVKQYDQRQRRLITLATILAGGILLTATCIEILGKLKSH